MNYLCGLVCIVRRKKRDERKFDYKALIEQGDSLIEVLETLNKYNPVFTGSIVNLKQVNHLLKEQLEETKQIHPELFI